jgi:hypothetical protein
LRSDSDGRRIGPVEEAIMAHGIHVMPPGGMAVHRFDEAVRLGGA